MRMRPTTFILAVRLLLITTLRRRVCGAHLDGRRRRPFSPPRSIWPGAPIPPPAHPLPMSRLGCRSAAALQRGQSAQVLRAICLLDVYRRLSPRVVLFWMCIVVVLIIVSSIEGSGTPCASVRVYMLWVFVVLLLEIWRPVRKIPLSRKMGIARLLTQTRNLMPLTPEGR